MVSNHVLDNKKKKKKDGFLWRHLTNHIHNMEKYHFEFFSADAHVCILLPWQHQQKHIHLFF